MKLKAVDLREPSTISISGDEPWLAFIYQSFAIKGQTQPKLTGEVTVTPAPYDVFHIRGHVRFHPLVNCGRCQDLITWEIERPIEVRYLARYEGDAKEEGEEVEVDLTPQDLDSYYLRDGYLDLEPVINDVVQTALPNRLIKVTADGKNCAVCLENVEEQLVYEDECNPEVSPFAKLKGIKFPDS
jgi:uncharacterized metal-binding protein YceD (DUF177 family)